MLERARVESISSESEVLFVRCSGVFGGGTDGIPDANRIRQAIENWMRENSQQRVKEIVVDFTAVVYVQGDSPAAMLLPLMKSGINKFRILASSQNKGALESLVTMLGLVSLGFSVEGKV